MDVRILILEQNEFYYNKYIDCINDISIEHLNFHCLHVQNKEEALEKVTSANIHLLITDYSPPQTDSLQLLDEINKLDLLISTIFITDQGSEDVAVSAFRKGVQNYFIKKDNFSWDDFQKGIIQIINHLFPIEKESKIESYHRFDWDHLTLNQNYDFAFLTARILSPKSIVSLLSKEEIDKLYNSIRDYIVKKIESYNGQIWNQIHDLVLGGFYSKEGIKIAVLCGIDALVGLNIFNMGENSLPEGVGVIIAITFGEAKYMANKNEVVSDAINHVSHIVYFDKTVDQLYLGRTVHKPLDPRLKEKFHESKIIDGRPVFQFYYSI